jgi:RNA polymerase sigma-70 factor (ECF subfamily)
MHPYEQKFLNDFELLSDELFRFCFFQTSKREVAIDLVQDCFVEIWNYIKEGNGVQNMRAFCYTVLRRRIIDWRRKRKTISLDFESQMTQRDTDAGGFVDTLADSEFSATYLVGEQEEKEREQKLVSVVKESLLELNESDRELVQLRCIEEYSVAKMSEILGVSAPTLSVQIYRARDKLKKILEQKGVGTEFLNEYD